MRNSRRGSYSVEKQVFRRFSTFIPTVFHRVSNRLCKTFDFGGTASWVESGKISVFFIHLWVKRGFWGSFPQFSGFPKDNGGRFSTREMQGEAWNGDSRGERYSRISRKMGSLVAAIAFTAPRRALGFAFPKSIWMQAEKTEAFREKLLFGSET